METSLLVVSLAALLLGVLLVAGVFTKRRRAQAAAGSISWLDEYLERSRRQLESEDVEEVLAGLQAFHVLNDPGKRISVMPVITELTKSENPRIAKQAQVTYAKLLASLQERSGS